MDSQAFDRLVERLARAARENPAAYRFRVVLLGALGYVYIYLILAVLLAALVGLGFAIANGTGTYGAIKLAIPLVALCFVVVRALWVRIAPPQGIPITTESAPRLHHEVESVRRAMRAPRVHRIVLTDDFNAAVAQVPRLGAFGWYRNHVIIGLPLLAALPVEEFRAVLAHEFGHLSRAHGRGGTWIYRIRTTWYLLMAQFEQSRHWGVFLFDRFFRWYAPLFGAYSFVLARQAEYEADRHAADATAPEHLARALARLAIGGRYLAREFWPRVYGRATEEATPPGDTIASMLFELCGDLSPDAVDGLDEALREPTRSGDTHPSLEDRLTALGVEPPYDEIREVVMTGAGPQNAAYRLLGKTAATFASRLGGEWAVSILPAWQERHQAMRHLAGRLEELDGAAADGRLGPDEAKERAWATAELHGAAAAIPLFREIQAAGPVDPETEFLLGRLLLEVDDTGGIDHLERAMADDARFVEPACELAYAFLQRAGRSDEAETYWRRLQRHVDQATGVG